MLTYAFASNIFVFCIGGLLLGTGLSWTTTTMVGYVVNQWCKENKGTIMGLILASNGIGGAIAIQVLSPLIYQEGQIFAYRNAYLLVALILLIVGLLIVLFYKDYSKQTSAGSPDSNPDATGEDKSSAKKSKSSEPVKKRRGQNWPGLDYRSTLRKPYFYGALLCIFLTGFILQGMNGVAAAHMKDNGIDAAFVATVLSIHSLSLAVFKFLTGFIYDKFGLRITISICSAAAVISLLSLSFVNASSMGIGLAVVYGVVSGLGLPLETILLPIYASDLFGQKAFNKILGLIVSFNVAGFALGAPAINLCYDMFGSYVPGLFLGLLLMVMVLVLLQFIISAANKTKQQF